MSNILNITRNLWSLWVVVNHPWIWRIETCKIRFPRFFKQWASGSWTPATKSACKASPGTRKFKETGDQQNVLPCLEIPRSKVTTNNPPQRERKRTLEHFFSWQDARCIFAERKNITEIDRNHKFTFYVSNYIYIYMTGKQATLLFQVQCPEAQTIFCRKQLIPPRTQRALRQIQAELELLPSLPRLLPWPPSMRRICRINATVTNENGVQKFTKITWQRTSLLVIVVK